MFVLWRWNYISRSDKKLSVYVDARETQEAGVSKGDSADDSAACCMGMVIGSDETAPRLRAGAP